MNAKFEFDYGGIRFFVDVEIFDDDPAFVEDVNSVEIRTPSGDYMLAEFDEKAFKDTFQDLLDEKAEEYIKDLAIAYAEARMDARREEGVEK